MKSLPQTTQEALDLIWPDIGNPMATYWTDDQKLFAKRLAGACRLYETFGRLYEDWAADAITPQRMMAQLAVAAWGEM